MRSVKSAIRADQFFYAMRDMTEWQVTEEINPAFSTHLRQANGDCIFHVRFAADGDAEKFVKRFGGSLVTEGRPFAKPIGGLHRPNAWAPRRQAGLLAA